MQKGLQHTKIAATHSPFATKPNLLDGAWTEKAMPVINPRRACAARVTVRAILYQIPLRGDILRQHEGRGVSSTSTHDINDACE